MIKKKLLSLSLAFALVCSGIGFTPAKAEAAEEDWIDGIYEDLGHGFYKAHFPLEYPDDKLIVDDDAQTAMKIQGLLDTLTEDEKLGMLSADGAYTTAPATLTSQQWYSKRWGTGFWKGVARVGIPVVRMFDGPMGVRSNTGEETTRPANELSIASSFDKQAQYEYGAIYGEENKANAGNCQLGNQNDLIRRISLDRSRDMFSEDWYLNGVTSNQMAKGVEDNNTISCMKHFGGAGNADEQTLHENFLSGSEMAQKDGGAMAFMTNYGTVNGINACHDSYILKDVLRNMWGFKGLVMADWGGNYSFSIDDGMTMTTPDANSNTPDAIRNNIASGVLTWADVDEAVSYNLHAIAKVGYLGLVMIDRDGQAVIDEDKQFVRKPANNNDTMEGYSDADIIELPGITGEERDEMLDRNNEKAIELATKGAVLLKNEDYAANPALPLKPDEKITLVGLGSTRMVPGHQHECSFGSLRGLSVSPADALREIWPEADIENYVTMDTVGEPVPGEYLYQDEAGTTPGVVWTGTDNEGNAVNTTAADINFVTNSINYKNAEDGTAFEYHPVTKKGVDYTFTTYLKAPATGTYTFGVEGIAWSSTSATITVNGSNTNISRASGSVSLGMVPSTGVVCTETGLDVPTSFTSVNLTEGELYRIQITANSDSLAAGYSYQRGTKDSQLRLAWFQPDQKQDQYQEALDAVEEQDTTVVIFAHSYQNNMNFESVAGHTRTQVSMIDDMVAAAKAVGNKVVLVLSTALPAQITKWAEAGDSEVDAILQMWMPGQGGGTAIANLLSGEASPSGKLTVAWPRNSASNGAADNDQGDYTSGEGNTPYRTYSVNNSGVRQRGISIQVKEGIFNGYKWYDARGEQDHVLYDFGYGLSYADFEYTLEKVSGKAEGSDEYGYDFYVNVKNVGNAKGSDAPQIYIGAADEELFDTDKEIYYHPDQVQQSWRYVFPEGVEPDTNANTHNAEYFPVIDGIQQVKYQLAGYERTSVLNPGEDETVVIHVDQRSLSYWDVDIADDQLLVRSDGTKHKYRVIEGDREFFLGKSSDEFVTVDGETSIPVKVAKATTTTISLNASSATLEEGETKQLVATLSPSTATDAVTWESSNEAVATVTAGGEVRAISVGNAVITAKLLNGNQAACSVTVTNRVPSNNGLKQFIDYAEEQMKLDEYQYVAQNIKDALQAALTKAKEVFADPGSTQEEINEAALALLKWIQSLDMREGDKVLLSNAIDMAETLVLSDYVARGQARFKRALENAKAALNDLPISQEEIDEALDELYAAMLALRFKADTVVLENLLQQAKLVNTNQYTAATARVLLDAIEKAELVLTGDITKDNQHVVDNSASALQNAIKGLVKNSTSPVVVKKKLAKAANLKLNAKKVTWKSSSNNNGYKLAIQQGGKIVKSVNIKKGKTSYTIPKGVLKKNKKYKVTLVAKGTGDYIDSDAAVSKTVKMKQLAKPKGLKISGNKVTWKKVNKNKGYTLKVLQGKKTVKTVQLKKNKKSYKIPGKLMKKGKKYRISLTAKGSGNYLNSKATKSGTVKK